MSDKVTNQKRKRIDTVVYNELSGEFRFGKYLPFNSKIKRLWGKLSSAWTQSHHFHCNPFNSCGLCSNQFGGYTFIDRIAYVLRFYIRGSY
jgi:hypothetical protein